MDSDELRTYPGITREELDRICAGILALATDTPAKSKEECMAEKKIETLILLAQAVERSYEITSPDDPQHNDWQAEKEVSRAKFDAYIEFSRWGRGKSVDEIKALLAMAQTGLAQKILFIAQEKLINANDALEEIETLCKEQLTKSKE